MSGQDPALLGPDDQPLRRDRAKDRFTVDAEKPLAVVVMSILLFRHSSHLKTVSFFTRHV
jgi:hypothetical protein